MARTRIRRKKKSLIHGGRLESRLRGTKYAGSRIGPADDRFEREADIMANRVVSGSPPDPVFDSRPDPDAPVSAYQSAGAGGALAGERLPPAELAFFQRRMGFNFANVRVRADAGTDAVARSINAKAFTRGNEIAFAKGAYQPGSMEGRRLLAHELTHVVQQGGGGSSGAPGPRTQGAETDGGAKSRVPAGGISAQAPAGAVQRTLRLIGKGEMKGVKEEVVTPMACEKKFAVIFIVGTAELGFLNGEGNFQPKKTLKHGMVVDSEQGMHIRLKKGSKMEVQGMSGMRQKLKATKEDSLFSCGAERKRPSLRDLIPKRGKERRNFGPTAGGVQG